MGKRVLFLAAGMIALTALGAFGEVRDFNDFSVDVPAGWSAEQQGATVVMKAVSSDASLSLAVASMGEATAEEIAQKLYEQLGGVDLEKDEDGDFSFMYLDTAGVESYVCIIDGKDGTYLVTALSGIDKPGGELINGIIESVKFHEPEDDENGEEDERDEKNVEFDEDDDEESDEDW